MQPEDANSQHLTFSKKERICSKLTIERVLDKKQKVFVYPYKCFYDFTPASDEADVNRMLVSVPKRSFKHAVDRNRLKRLTREAYRLNKHLIESLPAEHGKSASLFFVFVGNETLPFNFINDKIILVLNRLLSDNIENIDNKV